MRGAICIAILLALASCGPTAQRLSQAEGNALNKRLVDAFLEKIAQQLQGQAA